jgi:endonuclease/exonuclease/phosphatase family metal-dependent hydrolase
VSKTFSTAEWTKITARLQADPARYGWPERRDKSVVLAGFNIRKCGDSSGRSKGAMDLLARFIAQCDLVAVQEVMDNMEMLMTLRAMASDIAGVPFEVIVSDVTGGVIGGRGMTERLAFVFRPDRVIRGPVAGDISYDRSAIFRSLYVHRSDFLQSTVDFDDKWFRHYEGTIARQKYDLRVAEGKTPRGERPGVPGKPDFHAPQFVAFIRTPHMATFSIPVSRGDPYELTIINAHLLFGGVTSKKKIERENEFHALIDWMADRAVSDRSHNPNYVLIGDLNLAFDEDDDARRDQIMGKLLGLGELKRRKQVSKVNFPFIIPREDPITGDLATVRTNARASETFDQIGIMAEDERLPGFEDNAGAGTARDGYDYNVFNFADLFSEAVLGEGTLVRDLKGKEQSAFVDKFQHDVSDHMPIWMRLPR